MLLSNEMAAGCLMSERFRLRECMADFQLFITSIDTIFVADYNKGTVFYIQ